MIQTEKGTEYLNSIFQNLLKEKKIIFFQPLVNAKASPKTRFNRTMKAIMFKYFTKNNTRRYIDSLPDLVAKHNFNLTITSFNICVKMKPFDVEKQN